MEKFQESLLKAKKNIHLADHMIFVTYKLVNDPRLLLSAIKNIFNSLQNTVDSLLYYERVFKRISAYPENFGSKFSILKDNCNRLNLNQSYLYLIKDIHTLLVDHKNSPVEFSRKDRFIICSSNYRTKSISLKEIKEYLSRSKSFINEVETIVMKDARIFS